MSEPQKVTRAKQKGALGPVPKQPTEGWMRHELEANGVRALGRRMTKDAMVAALRGLGYDVA